MLAIYSGQVKRDIPQALKFVIFTHIYNIKNDLIIWLILIFGMNPGLSKRVSFNMILISQIYRLEIIKQNNSSLPSV